MRNIEGITPGKRISFLVSAIILVLAAVGISVAAYLKPNEELLPEGYDPAGRVGLLFGEKATGDKNDPTVLSYRINTNITFSSSDARGDILVENPSQNCLNMTVTLQLDDETVLYQSELLPPESHISYDRLDTAPDPGVYNVTAVFTGLDPETGEAVGSVSCPVTVTVQ